MAKCTFVFLFVILSFTWSVNAEQKLLTYGDLVADLPRILEQRQEEAKRFGKVALSDEFLDLTSKLSRQSILRSADSVSFLNNTSANTISSLLPGLFPDLNVSSLLSQFNTSLGDLSKMNLSSLLPMIPNTNGGLNPNMISSLLPQLVNSNTGLTSLLKQFNVSASDLLGLVNSVLSQNPNVVKGLNSLLKQFNMSANDIPQLVNSVISQNPNSMNGLSSLLKQFNMSAGSLPQLLGAIMSQMPNSMDDVNALLKQFNMSINEVPKLISNVLSQNPELVDRLDSFLSPFNMTSEELLETVGYFLSQGGNIFQFPPYVSPKCQNDVRQLVWGLTQRKDWALRMLDAAGKIPTDLLNFNFHWYGSFDECRAIKVSYNDLNRSISDSLFKGQYCSTTVKLPVKADLYQNGNPVDVSLTWDICLPESCGYFDVTLLLNSILNKIKFQGKPLTGSARFIYMNDLKLDDRAIAISALCGVFAFVMVLGTLYDLIMIQYPLNQRKKQKMEAAEADKKDSSNLKYKIRDDKYVVAQPEVTLYEPGIPGKLLLSFSVYTNGKKLLNTNQPSGTLGAINGIRFLSMSWVILGHAIALSTSYISNLASYAKEVYPRTSFQAIANALVSVDSFFTLSGLLLTYLVLKEMKRNKGKLNWFMFYFHRFWRLTPAYMLILGVTSSLEPYLYNGPNYYQLTADSGYDSCTKSWWTNLLYVNNFFRLDHQCFAHAWYLANDMQFYVLSPLLLLPLFHFKKIGVILTLGALLASWIVTGVLAHIKQWPPTTLGGGNHPAGKMFNDYYIKPYCRVGPYLAGMVVGYILYATDCKVKINKYLNLLGWAVATVAASVVLYGLRDAFNGHPLSDDVSALYLTTHRTVWGAAVAWVIFACATGNGGYINTLLSWKAFVPLGRLTYCAYLIHPAILAIYNMGLRVPWYVTDLTLIYTFLGHLVFANMAAFVLCLAFESPMMALEKVVFPKKPK